MKVLIAILILGFVMYELYDIYIQTKLRSSEGITEISDEVFQSMTRKYDNELLDSQPLKNLKLKRTVLSVNIDWTLNVAYFYKVEMHNYKRIESTNTLFATVTMFKDHVYGESIYLDFLYSGEDADSLEASHMKVFSPEFGSVAILRKIKKKRLVFSFANPSSGKLVKPRQVMFYTVGMFKKDKV